MVMRLPTPGETARHRAGHTGETNALHLDSTTQTRIGLVVESVATTSVPFVVRGDARVLDPRPATGLERGCAQSDRLRKLNKWGGSERCSTSPSPRPRNGGSRGSGTRS